MKVSNQFICNPCCSSKKNNINSLSTQYSFNAYPKLAQDSVAFGSVETSVSKKIGYNAKKFILAATALLASLFTTSCITFVPDEPYHRPPYYHPMPPPHPVHPVPQPPMHHPPMHYPHR